VSPVRPENRALYPADWKEIATRVRARASNRCECKGECGSKHGSVVHVRRGRCTQSYYSERCGVPQHELIERDPDRPEKWEVHGCTTECVGEGKHVGAVRVVLTVAHLDHDPTNNRMGNLRALCQLCHNRYDREHRKVNAARTRHGRRAHADLFQQGAS